MGVDSNGYCIRSVVSRSPDSRDNRNPGGVHVRRQDPSRNSVYKIVAGLS